LILNILYSTPNLNHKIRRDLSFVIFVALSLNY
jgi:hypothetical protein